jgi:hypothetical protein
VALAAAAPGLGIPEQGIQLVLAQTHGAAHTRITATVRGVPGNGAIWIELAGATDARARAQRRVLLRPGAAGWRGVLAVPVLVGVYPVVVLRGGRRYVRDEWLVRVLPSAAAVARRTFATPAAAARDWVAHLPAHQVLVATRSWRKTALDRRDRRLNAMLVVAYAPRGSRGADDRRGIFLTMARDRVGGRWRILQASIAPYG